MNPLLRGFDLLDLQRRLGNRATTKIIARRSTEEPDTAAPDVLALLARDAPGLLPLIRPAEIEGLQKRLEISTRNDELSRRANRVERQFEATYHLPARGAGHIQEQANAIRDGIKPVGGPLEIVLPASALFAPEMVEPPRHDVALVNRFRAIVKQGLAQQPVKVMVAGRGNDAHVEIRWLGYARPHTRGLLTLEDIKRWGFRKDYQEQVVNAPEKRQLADALKMLSNAVIDVSTAHLERSDKNREHPVVRHISEMFGGPDTDELVRIVIDAREHPEKGSLEERLKELEVPYPSVKMWELPKAQLDEARAAIRDQGIEVGTLAVLRAEKSVLDAVSRFAAYEQKVLKGAGVAVTWLQRIKVGSKILLGVLSGGQSLGVQALIAGGYSFAQEGAQQASEVAHGMRESIDVGGLARQAGVEGAMALFSGLTQGAFTRTLTARFGTSLTETVGPFWAKRIISTTSATTAQFYATPANIVLKRIVEGGKLPGSLEELADMIAKEAKLAAIIDFGLGSLVDALTGGLGAEADTSKEGETGPRTPKSIEEGNPKEAGVDALGIAHAQETSTTGAGGGGKGGGEPPRTTGGGGGKGGGDNPFAGLTDAEIDAAVGSIRSLGPLDQAPAPGLSDRAELVGGLDRSKPLSASGFAGSLAESRPGFGAFDATVRTERGQQATAVLKIVPANKAAAFQKEVAAAKAAAATGVGPPFYGVVDVDNGLAFAMGKVPGGFTENLSTADAGTAAHVKAEAEASAALGALTEQAPQDVRNYGDALVHLGYYYDGEVQGLIGPDGRWRPIDFQGIAALPADAAERRAAIEKHRGMIEHEAHGYEKDLSRRGGPGAQ